MNMSIGIFKIIQDIAEDSNSYLSPNNITISGFNLLSACVVLFNDIAIELAKFFSSVFLILILILYVISRLSFFMASIVYP